MRHKPLPALLDEEEKEDYEKEEDGEEQEGEDVFLDCGIYWEVRRSFLAE